LNSEPDSAVQIVVGIGRKMRCRVYTREQAFSLHFCRKADPESKGKVENLIKYVKQNFLYNRPYHNIETLNDEAMGWLGRTANFLPHAVTQKLHFAERILEIPFLTPYRPDVAGSVSLSTYGVRRDNTIYFKGNFSLFRLASIWEGKPRWPCRSWEGNWSYSVPRATHKYAGIRFLWAKG
jgi:hypothetical protein